MTNKFNSIILIALKEEAPTMSTGSTAQAAGFSGDSDPNGPTAGLDEPLGGIGRPLKGRKFKCKTKIWRLNSNKYN